jgi:hypothetical protein
VHLSSNLSTYYLAVIRPWSAIMGPTLLPKPSLNLLRVMFHCWNEAFLTRCSSINCSWCREQPEGWLICPCRALPVVWSPDFMVATQLFTHLSIGYMKLKADNFCGNRVFKIRELFSSAVTCATVVLRFFETTLLKVTTIYLFLSMLVFAHCFSSLMSSRDSCTATLPFKLPLSTHVIM